MKKYFVIPCKVQRGQPGLGSYYFKHHMFTGHGQCSKGSNIYMTRPINKDEMKAIDFRVNKYNLR